MIGSENDMGRRRSFDAHPVWFQSGGSAERQALRQRSTVRNFASAILECFPGDVRGT